MARRKFELIDNRGPNNLLATLKKVLSTSHDVALHVAFVSLAGVRELLPAMCRASLAGRVRLITGLYQGITEPQALRKLLVAQKQTKDQLSVRISKNGKLHRKVYACAGRQQVRLVFGSSNLTQDGLNSPGELNVLLRIQKDDPAYKLLMSQFESEWERNSVTLTEKRIARYESRRPKSPAPGINLSSIKDILGTDDEKPEDNRIKKNSQCYYRDSITGFVSARTETVIEKETDWDKRGLLWYNRGERYNRGDRILLLDRTGRTPWARVVEVIDFTRTSTSTPDGRWFTAYRRLRRSKKRRINKAFWKDLAAGGVKPSTPRRYGFQEIKAARWDAIRKSLNL